MHNLLLSSSASTWSSTVASVDYCTLIAAKFYSNYITLKSKIEIKALEYLQRKRGSKGKEIKYTKLEMSEYLLPFNAKLNIEKKRPVWNKK